MYFSTNAPIKSKYRYIFNVISNVLTVNNIHYSFVPKVPAVSMYSKLHFPSMRLIWHRHRLSIGGFCRPKFVCIFGFFLLAILVIWIGERHNFTVVYRPIQWMNSSSKEGQPNGRNISVIVIVDRAEQLEEYGLAQFTLKCFCALRQYPYHLIDLSKEPALQRECPQKDDFFFRRHCVFAQFLAANPSIQFALFLDADMGVINPNHSLEQFIVPFSYDPKLDLIFYERIFNGEIVSGSYFLRNSPFSRQFLHYWANYHFRVPNSFHGTDNGAIHAVFFDLFCGPFCADQWHICQHCWNISTGDRTLRTFSDCARQILGMRNIYHTFPNAKIGPGKVLLLTDNQKYWARDGWLTKNAWSPHDFIFHGWQKRRQDMSKFAGWSSPLALSPEQLMKNQSQNCNDPNLAALNWPYKNSFMRNDEEIGTKLKESVYKRRAETLDVLKGIL